MAQRKRKNLRFDLYHTRKLRRAVLVRVPLRKRQEKARRSYISWRSKLDSLPAAARQVHLAKRASYASRHLSPKSKKRLFQQSICLPL